MEQWFSANDLAGKPGLPGTARGINKMGDRGEINRRKKQKGKGWEYQLASLPASAQAALLTVTSPKSPATLAGRPQPDQATQPGVANLAASPTSTSNGDAALFEYDRDALWAHYEKKPQKQKEKAQLKLTAINMALTLIANGIKKTEAWAQAAQQHGFNKATLYRWYSAVIEYDRPDWLAALVPGYTGRTTTAECSPEAWDYFKADYLRLEAPAASAVYDRLKRAAAAHGWNVPSLKTLERKLNKEVSRSAIILAREGVEALKRSFPAQERDRTVFHALEAVNADGHKFDVFVKFPDGEIGRVLMVAWQDIYSGKILSYRLDKTENTDGVRLSFGDLVERYGIPEHAFLDNGRGFASKWMTGGTPTRFRFKVREEEPAGILTCLGIDVHWATPYHGQAKPIERAFRDLCEYVAKHPDFAGAYTGNNPMAKPENYGSRAVPFDKFAAVLKTEIAAHNARQGRRSPTCNGRSFDETFNQSYAASPIRKATAEQRRLWLLAAEGVRVKRDGSITLKVDKENRYWSRQLHELAGHQVVVRFDPQDLHSLVHVYTLDGRYIGEATCDKAAGFNDSQAARERARVQKHFNRAARQQLEAERRMDVMDAAKRLPTIDDSETPDANIVRPFRPAQQLRATVQAMPLNDKEQAQLEQLTREMENPSAEVVDILQTPEQRYGKAYTLEQRMEEGKEVTTSDQNWLASYQGTSEYNAQRDYHNDFGITPFWREA